MSSAGERAGGNISGGIAALPKSYFCYQCNCSFSIELSPNPLCPFCNDGFLEEVESDDQNPNFDPFPGISESIAGLLGGFPLVFQPSGTSTTAVDLQNPRNFSNMIGSESVTRSDGFNPFMFLQNHLENLRANGANFQFVIENHPAELRLPANIGDYFLGPGLEQLIQQLAENDPNRYGTPPAAKSAVENLPVIKIGDEVLGSDSTHCAVCMEEFEIGVEVRQMPCKHMFHSDCILPWLQLHNSCPVCRFELPTDDPDYENRGPGPGNSGSSGGGGSSGGSDGGGSGENRAAERMLRISLPWPFRGFGSQGEASDGQN